MSRSLESDHAFPISGSIKFIPSLTNDTTTNGTINNELEGKQRKSSLSQESSSNGHLRRRSDEVKSEARKSMPNGKVETKEVMAEMELRPTRIIPGISVSSDNLVSLLHTFIYNYNFLTCV